MTDRLRLWKDCLTRMFVRIFWGIQLTMGYFWSVHHLLLPDEESQALLALLAL
jgi:hypothetical protein